jgi:peptide alpha-N-acetyltransferase
MLDKGVPSTFANLKHLYTDSFKKETLASLAEKYLKSQNTDSSSKDKGEASALFFLAQHYNYHKSRDLAKAMEYVEKAIEKDPKSVDYNMTKARILKHEGNIAKASEAMEYARSLDLKDRYINSKAAKYQLRNNESEKALKTVGLFTRADTVGGPLADLLDMQCVWYLTEDGEAYARIGDVGMALKRFHAIANIFDVWQEDQFDFHGFSLRKGQIRAYVDMIRWEDHIRDHPFYSRAALDAINVYLKLADKPSANGVNGANGDDAESALAKKKAAKKAKKEQQRLEREAAEKQAKQDPNKGTQADTKKKDDDPLGLKLAATEDPLGEATKFLVPLLQACPKSIEAQHAGFEVYMRRSKYQVFIKSGPITDLYIGKFVLALACLNAAASLDPKSPRVHEQAIAFRHMLNNTKDLPPKVQEVLSSEFTLIGPTTDLKAHNDSFQSTNKSSLSHVLSSIRAKRTLGESKDTYEKELLGLLELPGATYADALDILETLRSWWSQGAEAFRKAALAKWPEVTRLS